MVVHILPFVIMLAISKKTHCSGVPQEWKSCACGIHVINAKESKTQVKEVAATISSKVEDCRLYTLQTMDKRK
eukprot:c12969_g1_i1 orf=237-455(-)